ncbi:MAG: hypothetical protein U9N45_00765 [Gemmatimonadota bacterium]|nr:hypothetical protein [Gemmatimonadota bacterium]
MVEITGGLGRVVVKQALKLEDRQVEVVIEWSLEGRELSWEARLEGGAGRSRSLWVAIEVLLQERWKIWVQTQPEMLEAGCCRPGRSFWYVRAPEGYDRFDNKYSRHDLTLPLTVLLAREGNLGVTVAHPVDRLIPSAGFETVEMPDGSVGLRSVTALVGLRGEEPLKVKGYLVAHQACYRPGLEWMMNKWPEYFLPDPGIYEKGGIFSSGWPGMAKKGLDGRYGFEGYFDYNAYFMEIHMHFPWYGLYYPDNPETDTWADVWNIERESPREKGLSIQLINRRLELLKKAGFHTFYYFAINDGYPPEVERRWPDAIACWPGGKAALSGWRGGGIDYRLMNADTSLSFGRELVRQAGGILGQVEPLSGIFFDTMHHNGLDFAHDDGITLVYLDGRSVPAYSVNFCYDFFLEYLSKRLHAAGQHLFINGPTNIRNGLGVDAVMLEGEGAPEWEYEFEYRRFLSSMARPMYWLFPARPRLRREILLQRCLVYGAFPSAPPTARRGAAAADSARAEQDKDLWKPYLPLYEMLRGRMLCFEPDPLSLPVGCRGEVFTMPDGSYRVALINERMSALDPVNSARVRLGLMLEKKITKVMVFTPTDQQGMEIERVYRNNGELRLELGDFRGAALLALYPE